MTMKKLTKIAPYNNALYVWGTFPRISQLIAERAALPKR